MENQHDIDKLFKDALNGANSSQAYSESAWKGANTLLNRHYRAVLFKKIAWIGIPVIVGATALTLFVAQNEDHSRTSVYDIMEISASSKAKPLSTSDVVAVDTSENSIAYESKDLINHSSSIASKESVNENIALTEETSSVDGSRLNNLSTNISSVIPSKKNTIKVSSFAAQNTTSASVTAPLKTAEKTQESTVELSLNDNMEWMPTFKIGRLNDTDHSSSVLSRSQPIREELMKRLRRVELGVNAGGLIASGMQNTNSKSESPSIGIFAGITGAYHVNARLFISTGIILHERSKLASAQLVQNNASGTVHSNAEHLTYMDIPLQIGYNMGARHSLLFGMTFSPLIGYVPSTETSNVNDNSSPTITREKNLIRDGFADFDVAGALSYRYQLTQRIDLTADVRFGLFDLTDNQYFNTRLVDDRNHQLRIGLNYRFINR